MTASLFLADDLAAARPGGRLTLTGPEARHAATVQRLGVGEDVDLADGRGRRVRAVVAAVAGKDELVLDVREVLDEPAPPVDLVLVQALAKGGRDEQAVESAVEIGVGAVVPWRAQRCVSVWQGPRIDKGKARWEATVRAATKQSRRARLARVGDMVTTAQLAQRASEVVKEGGAVLVLHEEASSPLARAAIPRAHRPSDADGSAEAAGAAGAAEAAGAAGAAGAPGAAPRIVVVVGPEGGIAPEETDRLARAGAQVVRLGPHVLRSSTAGPVALALLAQRLGLWA